jgi:FHS family L-fucose permease-like MFS transporter
MLMEDMCISTEPLNKKACMTTKKTNYLLPFILVTTLFFLWGIANNLNGILIPHLRKALLLSNMQSTFVDTAVYFAYFIAALPAGWLLQKFGYKRGIITGLLVFSLGCFLFIPAAYSRTYEIFLAGLFIIGCGLTILETAANPYAAQLGDTNSSTARLNLAQSFNGLAVFIAPLIGTFLILSGKSFSNEELTAMSELARNSYLDQEAQSVILPYAFLGGFLLFIAIIFLLYKFPEFKQEDQEGKSNLSTALKNPHTRWAIVAQFFYVGAQVCVTSFFIRVAMSGGGADEITAGKYLSAYGLLFMLGRFLGSILMRFIDAAKLLTIYSLISIVMCTIAIYTDGQYVVLALGGLGFFMSIMFPTIFSLGIKGLKEETKAASSLIVMSIIGGAIFPVAMGYIIDQSNDNIQIGYIVPLICFIIVLLFGWKGHKIKSTP